MTPAEDIVRGEALADRDHAREQEFLAAQTEMDAAQDHYDDVCSHMGHTGDPHEAAARLVAAHARMQAAEVAMQAEAAGRGDGVRPRLLDLFCGAGGAAMGYHRAGFEVVGVDITPQLRYPFEFHQGDALHYLAEHWREFDTIHASPPCQHYLNLGGVNRAQGRQYDHPDLIAATRELLLTTGLPYVIENVADACQQLRGPVRICGTGLSLPLRRHRLFESDVVLEGVACAHDRYTVPRYWTGWRPNGEHRLSTVVQVYGNAGGRDEWPAAMGIDWMTPAEMCEAVPPAYTEWIGRQLAAHLAERAA